MWNHPTTGGYLLYSDSFNLPFRIIITTLAGCLKGVDHEQVLFILNWAAKGFIKFHSKAVESGSKSSLELNGIGRLPAING